MALWCLDQRGELRAWPRPGGWHEQDDYELQAIRIAWKTYWLMNNPKKWGNEEAEFLIWLNSDDDDEDSLTDGS